MSRLPVILLTGVLFSTTIRAQTVTGLPEKVSAPGAPGYDPQALFAPGFYGDGHLATRSPNGAPSATYWQNRADYTLSVRLDTVHNELEGSAVIRYTNNSPDSLHSLWLYLDQQTYRPDARSNFFTSYPAGGHTEGYSSPGGRHRRTSADTIGRSRRSCRCGWKHNRSGCQNRRAPYNGSG